MVRSEQTTTIPIDAGNIQHAQNGHGKAQDLSEAISSHVVLWILGQVDFHEIAGIIQQTPAFRAKMRQV